MYFHLINMEELNEAVKRIKTAEAPGTDEIGIELNKYVGEMEKEDM